MLVSASLAARPGNEDKIEIADPSDPTKTILIEERYPGESQWFVLMQLKLLTIFRMSQIAATENQMRAEGKIDKNGHLKNGKAAKKAKKQEKQDQ